MESHPLDFQLPIEKLDIDSMKKHDFIAEDGNLHFLPYTITFPRRKHFTVSTIDRIVILPAPLLNLVGRENLSVSEAELDTLEELAGPDSRGNDEEYEGGFIQAPKTSGFVYPDLGYAGPSGSYSTAADADHNYTGPNPPSWSHYSPWG